jgi:hypothetical protein
MKTFVLDKTISWLLGGQLFAQVKEIVSGLADQDVPGDKKREEAIAKAKEMLGDTATFMVNLAIEAAVYILKEQQKKS